MNIKTIIVNDSNTTCREEITL